jgi:hypothetical protein
VSEDSTIENRVYLFKALASAYLANAGSQLSSDDDDDRARAIEALSELARISCVVADTEDEPPERVRDLVLEDDDDEDERDASG